MIIEYLIGYVNQPKVMCCGEFRDLTHFLQFCVVEQFAGRIVTTHTVVRQ